MYFLLAGDGKRYLVRSRGLGVVYKGQNLLRVFFFEPPMRAVVDVASAFSTAPTVASLGWPDAVPMSMAISLASGPYTPLTLPTHLRVETLLRA